MASAGDSSNFFIDAGAERSLGRNSELRSRKADFTHTTPPTRPDFRRAEPFAASPGNLLAGRFESNTAHRTLHHPRHLDPRRLDLPTTTPVDGREPQTIHNSRRTRSAISTSTDPATTATHALHVLRSTHAPHVHCPTHAPHAVSSSPVFLLSHFPNPTREFQAPRPLTNLRPMPSL